MTWGLGRVLSRQQVVGCGQTVLTLQAHTRQELGHHLHDTRAHTHTQTVMPTWRAPTRRAPLPMHVRRCLGTKAWVTRAGLCAVEHRPPGHKARCTACGYTRVHIGVCAVGRTGKGRRTLRVGEEPVLMHAVPADRSRALVRASGRAWA